MNPTRLYTNTDLHDLGPRLARQIHGRTAPDLADEQRTARRAEAWAWQRIVQQLSADPDFAALAAGTGGTR